MTTFDSQDYWEARFTNNSASFDWLIPASTFRELIHQVASDTSELEILHIGCGTSDPTALRELVRDPRQIENVDFAQSALDASSQRDMDRQDTGAGQSVHPMGWACLDLLTLDSVAALLGSRGGVTRAFDLILDKSTSDSIACGANMDIDLPYPLSVNGWTRSILQTGIQYPASIHPLHILAVHLAAVTVPNTGKWILISHSEDRLPFLPPYPRSVELGFLAEEVAKAGFVHPNQLWRLERKEEISRDETLAERKRRLASGSIHRPPVKSWLYVLVRTDVVVSG